MHFDSDFLKPRIQFVLPELQKTPCFQLPPLTIAPNSSQEPLKSSQTLQKSARKHRHIFITHDPGTPICTLCGRLIEGDFVKALGQTWHPEHFQCHHCGIVIRETRFHMHGGHPYCPEDYAMNFLHRCASCALPIQDTVIGALGKFWHRHHFVCSQCGRPLSNLGGYFERDDFAFCSGCFQQSVMNEESVDTGSYIRHHLLDNLSCELDQVDEDYSGVSGLASDIMDQVVLESTDSSDGMCPTALRN